MKYIKGDITQTELKDIIHGCNAKGVMGSGVAKAIKDKWPGAFEGYKSGIDNFYKRPIAYENTILGTVFTVACDDKTIHNAITQINYGIMTTHARYFAVIDAMRMIFVDRDYADRFAIPKIGCGLGGLDWNIMEVLLLELEKEFEIEFWVYDL